ncbi:MAG: hypothetical protein ACE5ES_02045 [Candidatus Nanoarchaeia archaeon]
MHPSRHFIFGLIFSIIIFYLFPQITLTEFFIIFFASFLIDIDHYIFYVFKKKDISLKNAYKWYITNSKKVFSLEKKQRNKYYNGFYFLHGVEVLLILLLLTFLSNYFFFIFIGFLFHLLLDYIEEIKYHDRIDKFSVVNDFLKFKKLKLIDE